MDQLGERWVPRPVMHQLGIVWLIIAMKILYGLAIELHSWSLFGIFPMSDSSLGIALLLLVGLNIAVAYRYNEDAIAAQAVLVLLAISSTVGSLGGELGVAGMVLRLHGWPIMTKHVWSQPPKICSFRER